MKRAVTSSNDVPGVAHTTLAFRLMRLTFRVSLVLTVAVILLIGLWAIAALISGTADVGGLLALVKSWFGAVSGT